MGASAFDLGPISARAHPAGHPHLGARGGRRAAHRAPRLVSQIGGKLVDKRWPANQPLTPREVLWGESGGLRQEDVPRPRPGDRPGPHASTSRRRRCRPGSTLVEAGDLPTQFMLLKSGAAQADGGAAFKAGDSIGGDNIISRTAAPGDGAHDRGDRGRRRSAPRTTSPALALGMSDDDDDYVVNVLGVVLRRRRRARRRSPSGGRDGHGDAGAAGRPMRRDAPAACPGVAGGDAPRRRRAARRSACRPGPRPPGRSPPARRSSSSSRCPAGRTCAPPTAGRVGSPSTGWCDCDRWLTPPVEPGARRRST